MSETYEKMILMDESEYMRLTNTKYPPIDDVPDEGDEPAEDEDEDDDDDDDGGSEPPTPPNLTPEQRKLPTPQQTPRLPTPQPLRCPQQLQREGQTKHLMFKSPGTQTISRRQYFHETILSSWLELKPISWLRKM